MKLRLKVIYIKFFFILFIFSDNIYPMVLFEQIVKEEVSSLFDYMQERYEYEEIWQNTVYQTDNLIDNFEYKADESNQKTIIEYTLHFPDKKTSNGLDVNHQINYKTNEEFTCFSKDKYSDILLVKNGETYVIKKKNDSQVVLSRKKKYPRITLKNAKKYFSKDEHKVYQHVLSTQFDKMGDICFNRSLIKDFKSTIDSFFAKDLEKNYENNDGIEEVADTRIEIERNRPFLIRDDYKEVIQLLFTQLQEYLGEEKFDKVLNTATNLRLEQDDKKESLFGSEAQQDSYQSLRKKNSVPVKYADFMARHKVLPTKASSSSSSQYRKIQQQQSKNNQQGQKFNANYCITNDTYRCGFERSTIGSDNKNSEEIIFPQSYIMSDMPLHRPGNGNQPVAEPAVYEQKKDVDPSKMCSLGYQPRVANSCMPAIQNYSLEQGSAIQPQCFSMKQCSSGNESFQQNHPKVTVRSNRDYDNSNFHGPTISMHVSQPNDYYSRQPSAEDVGWNVLHNLQKNPNFQIILDEKIDSVFSMVRDPFSVSTLEYLSTLENFDTIASFPELNIIFKPLHDALLATFFDIKNGKIIRKHGSNAARNALAWKIADFCEKIYSKKVCLEMLLDFKQNGNPFFNDVIEYKQSSVFSKAGKNLKTAMNWMNTENISSKSYKIEHNEHYQKCVTLNQLCKDGNMSQARELYDSCNDIEERIMQTYEAHWDGIERERLRKKNEQIKIQEQHVKKLEYLASADWPQELIANNIRLADIQDAMQGSLYLSHEGRDFVTKIDSDFIKNTSKAHKTEKQRSVHNRAIRVINKSVHNFNNAESDHIRFFNLATTSHAMAVCQFNALGAIELVCPNEIMQAGHEYLQTILEYEVELVKGAVCGFGKKLVHDIMHPQAICSERAEVAGDVANLAAKGWSHVDAFVTDVKNNPEEYAQACQEIAEVVYQMRLENIAYQTVKYVVTSPTQSLEEIHDGFCALGKAVANVYNGIAEQGNQLALNVEQFFRNSDPFEVGELVGEMVATGVEDAVIFKGAGIAGSFVKAKTIDGFTKLVKAGKASKAAQVARKIGKQTGQKFKRFVRAAEALGNEVRLTVTPEGISIPGMHFMEDSAEKLKNAVGGLSSAVYNELKSIAQLVNDPLKKELPSLTEKYTNYRKGFAEFSNKFIKMPYEHIFGIDFVIDKKGVLKNISGYHHDFMGVLEKSGMVEFSNKVFGKAGAYKADLIVNGKRIRKTFFPSHWTQEQIIQEVYGAYDKFLVQYDNGKGIAKLIESKVYELTSDNKYRVVVKVAEDLKVEMLVTKKGVIKSFYPLIP